MTETSKKYNYFYCNSCGDTICKKLWIFRTVFIR